MRVCVMGRTKPLIRAAQSLTEAGHEVKLVWTAKPESFYSASARDFEDLAQSLEAEFMMSPETPTRAGIDRLRKLDCDVAVSVNWPILIPAELIQVFPHGVLNAHAGDLPRYRGNACPNWAILNNEARIALTVHKMDEHLDTGPIVLKKFLSIDTSTYIGDVYAWLGQEIPAAFLEALDLLQDPAFSPQLQSTDPTEALRTYPRRPSDGFIYWERSTTAIHRLIRASSHPFAGAFTFLEYGPRVTVWRAELMEDGGSFLSVPGQVCYAIDGDPVIACGDGLLVLTDLSIGGQSHSESRLEVMSSLRHRLTGPHKID